jgi:hypothetical protein
MDPDQVDKALTQVSAANGFAFSYAHFNWAHVAAQFGDAIANRNEAMIRGAAVDSASDAISTAQGAGIPLHVSVSPEAVANGAASQAMTVAAFNFTSGGSPYSVAPGANGTLVGTKDGQAWQTWQLSYSGIEGNTASTISADKGATTVLQTLTSLNAQSTPSATKSSSPFDILA